MGILVQIKNSAFKYRFYISILLTSLFMGGCFFFGVQGPFNRNNYEILKIEVNNKTYYAPQELARISKERLQKEGGENNQLINIQANNLPSTQKSPQSDPLDKAFDNLVERNNLEENIISSLKPSSIQDLASITLKSTFSLNRGEGIVNGVIGCNRYTAKFFWQDSTKIVISGSASTRAMCHPVEVTEFENIAMKHFDGIFFVQKVKGKEYSYMLDNGIMRVYLK